MIRTVKRSLLMLLLIALWSAGAYADGVFSIRIEDLTNQSGIVMQRGAPGMLYLVNQSLGPNSKITLPGLTLAFSQFQDPSGYYESKLHFDGTVQALAAGSLRITVESNNYPGLNLPATLTGSYTANTLPPYATMDFGAWTNVYDPTDAGSVPGGAVPNLGAAENYFAMGSLPAIDDGTPSVYASPQTTSAYPGGTVTVGAASRRSARKHDPDGRVELMRGFRLAAGSPAEMGSFGAAVSTAVSSKVNSTPIIVSGAIGSRCRPPSSSTGAPARSSSCAVDSSSRPIVLRSNLAMKSRKRP